MRKIKGPYLTLLAGLVTAAVLLTLDVRATPSQGVAQYAGATATPPSPPSSATSPTPAGTPTASTVISPTPGDSGATAKTSTPVPNPEVADYAGRVDGGGASLAISIYHGQAVAYVCGGTFEVWFTGQAKGGRLALTSRYGATLTATYEGPTATAHGLVTGAGHHWTFTAPTVRSPSGLYRAYAKGRKIQATWIILPDGSQIGAEDAGGDTATASPVPALDLSTLSATLPDGHPVTASRIDASLGHS